MKNKLRVVLSSLVLALALNGQANAEFYDLYAGMLKKQGEQLVLSKCAIVSANFILKFENEKLKNQLPDLHDNQLVQLHVTGKLTEENGEYYLTVHDIAQVTIGASCNVTDELNEVK